VTGLARAVSAVDLREIDRLYYVATPFHQRMKAMGKQFRSAVNDPVPWAWANG
jgi:hypothetical protein